MRIRVYVTGGRPSVRLSTCLYPIDRQQHRQPAGLLLSALWTGDIDRQLCVPERITFKVATLTYHALHGSAHFGVVIHMCRRHAAPTQAQVRLH